MTRRAKRAGEKISPVVQKPLQTHTFLNIPDLAREARRGNCCPFVSKPLQNLAFLNIPDPAREARRGKISPFVSNPDRK